MVDLDFHFHVNLLLTSFVVVVAFVFVFRKKAGKPNLPPGPWKLPVIGNLHQLACLLPHHRLRDLARKHGDLMQLQLGELSHIVVSSAEVARDMMRTHDANFSQRPFLLASSLYDFKGVAFTPYGDYWRKLRKICVQELLSPARIRSFRSIREEEVSVLVKHLHASSGTKVNLSEEIFSMTYGITARAVFGNKCRDQEALIANTEEGMKLSGGMSVAELFPSQNWLQWITGYRAKLEKMFKSTDGILQTMVETCRADKSAKDKSLLEVLLDIQDRDGFGFPVEPKNIRAVIMDIFIAGSDTSSTALEWAMFELSRNPGTMEKAQAEVRQVFGKDGNIDEERLHELKYLSFIIKETLRLHPPAPLLLPRESIESCVISGYDIPAKTKVLVNAWAIGRDPRYWNDPEKFYPERFIDSEVDVKGTNFEFIPFGAGRRMCPGVSFAMADIELPLASLLFHFDWKLPNGIGARNDDVSEVFGLTVRPKDGIHLIPVPHSTTSISF